MVQAPAPERPLTGGIATEAVLAQVLVAKYSEHLPLYRQAQVFARHGIDLDRSTLANWVGRTCWWLRPLAELLLGTILSSPKIFADDTPVPVLDPGRGRTKTGRLWAYARDDRPWCGPEPPAVVYVYSENRQGVHPRTHLAEFAGVLQVDGYSGFNRLAGDHPKGAVTLAFCWAHVRRKFYDFHEATGSPIAAEALRRIAEIYAIEARIRGRPPDQRRHIRQNETKPLLEAMKTWLEQELGRVSAKSKLADAIRYALRHWQGLGLFLEDGRVEVDSNTVERTIRPIKLGRKNHLFAGSDGGAESWATIASLIQTALCRARHRAVYAARRTMPNGSGPTGHSGTACGPSTGQHPSSIRHSWPLHSASRKASRRSLGWKRVRLPCSYGLSLARAASLSARCACR